VIIGIVIVMNLFFNYAISLVYKAPEYPVLSPSSALSVITDPQACVTAGGVWSRGPQAYCDQDYTKIQQAFQVQQKQYDRSVFIVLVILGVLSVITGTLIEHEVLSLAFSWGGVLSLVIASMRYWSDANNLLKVFILAIALGGLIWTAIKKFA
jgi:hypothetical protein